MYQNLSRKFRPQTFASIVGQEAIVQTLKNSIAKNQLAPAYLFCGSRGTGKTTLARLLAKAINCHTLQENQEPCNACPSCMQIVQGRALDVLEIDGASNRGIDDIRKINDTLGYATSGSRCKVYIVDEVHMLTKEAFNALLKTLEEPPPNVIFIFATTEPNKIPPTILSRCQRFDLGRLSDMQIVSKLSTIATELGITVEPEAISLIAHVAEGGLRDAESIFDQLLCFEEGKVSYQAVTKLLRTPPRHFYFALNQAILSSDLARGFALSKELFMSGQDFHPFMEGLLDHFKMHLLVHLKLPLSQMVHASDRDNYLLAPFTQDHVLYMLDYLAGWLKEFGKTPFKQVMLEMILLHLIRSIHRVSLPALIRRLEGGWVVESKDAPVIAAVQPPQPVPAVVTEALEKRETPKQPLSDCVEEAPFSKFDLDVQRNKSPGRAVDLSEPPPIVTETHSAPLPPSQPKGHYDTILRFAAVELEGVLKKP